MKTYKTIQASKEVITEEHKELDYVNCDICGTTNLNNGRWNYSETTMALFSEDAYPEGGENKLLEYDICSECFCEKIVSLLKKELGIIPQITEKDW